MFDRNAIDGVKNAGGAKGAAGANGGAGQGAGNANDSFNKHYNKELKVSEGRYPVVLATALRHVF